MRKKTKIIIVLLACAVLSAIAGNAFAARQYGCTSLTGGGTGALDALDITGAGSPNSSSLADGDMAVVGYMSGTVGIRLHFVFDADGTDAESSPTVIRPDDYATAGVWRYVGYQAGIDADGDGDITDEAWYTKLVTNGDSHDHAGGDGAQIDHTGMSNIGTNTHAQIDTHIANTSNPHSVTAAQVGALQNMVEDTTPQLGGPLDTNGQKITDATGIDDDDCTGDQGKFWWDSTDNQWEFCNANSGTPIVVGSGAGGISNVIEDTTPQLGGNLDLNAKVLTDATGVDDDDCTGDQGKFWWDAVDSQWEGCNANSGTPVVLGAGGTGDITSVLGDTTGDVPVLFQTASTFTLGDANPDVSTATHWVTADTTTYDDFDGTPADGQQLWIYCAHAATFDLTASGIEAYNRTTDLTATVGFVAHLQYESADSQWHLINAPDSTATVSSNGFIARTGAGTAAARTLQSSSGGGLDWTNGDGVSGNPVPVIDLAPSSGNATMVEEDDALQVKYDTSDFSESASGLVLAADVTRTISSGTSALGTAQISSGACATVVTTSATGTATTDVVGWGFNSDPTSTTGYSASANGMLTIISYPTANNVNFIVCNNTASAITPGAVTLNWRVMR